jgi:iron complex transport system substrate-binding protein
MALALKQGRAVHCAQRCRSILGVNALRSVLSGLALSGLVLSGLALSGCGADTRAPEAFDQAPERILSLVPAVTQILLALDAEPFLVGRTDYDTARAVQGLPSVGGGIGPSLERVLELRPDLVIRFEGPSDLATADRLQAAGIPQLAVRPDGIDDVLDIVEQLGSVLRRETGAQALATRLRAELEAVRRQVAPLPAVRVVYLLGGDPPLVAAGGTFIHELLTIAGAVNLLADVAFLYAPISVEEILRLEPELVLASEGSRIPAGLRGIPLRSVPSWVEIPGPHMGESARLLAGLMHPSLLNASLSLASPMQGAPRTP